jgi:hypothetical protein
MATTGAVIARIISQYSPKGSKAAQKDIAKLGKKIDAFGRKATKAFAAAGVASVAFAGKLAVDAVQGAMEDQKAQASLAVALRNTTGATEQAIEANSRFLDSLELQVAIDNEELIPALKTLVTVTKNLSKAQGLLSLATDASAASGLSLEATAKIIAKAQSGQLKALNKLNLGLDQTAINAGDSVAAFKELAEVTKGQAETAANTFAGKLTTLKLRFKQVSESVGYALIPVFEKLVDRLENEVFPAFEKFIRLNKQEIVDTIAGTVTVIQRFAEAAVGLAKAIDSLGPLLKFFASAIAQIYLSIKLFAGVKLVTGILKGFLGTSKVTIKEIKQFGGASEALAKKTPMLAKTIKGLTAAVNVLRVAFGMTAVAGAAALGPIAVMIAAAVAVAYGAYKGLDYLLERGAKADNRRDAEKRIRIQQEIDAGKRLADSYDSAATRAQKAYEKQKAQQDVILAGFKQIEDAVKDANATAKQKAIDDARDARLLAEQLADEQKKLYIQGLERKGVAKLATLNRTLLTDKKKMEVQLAAIKAKNAKLDKAGIKLTDPDEMNAIQMEAIYQNLVKNGKILLAETTKQQKIADELKLKAAEDFNKALLRQADIVQHLDKLRANDIVVIGYLAKKWDMTTKAADMYIKSVLAIGEVMPDDAGILALGLAWSMDSKQAAKYLEFTAAIKAGHGNIGKEKLEELGRKWFKDVDNPTDAALKYEQALGALEDHEVGAKEVKKLADVWDTTPEKVAAYLLEVGKPFTLTDNAKLILSAEMIAKISGAWDKATLSLIEYLKAAADAAKIKIPGVTDGTPDGTPSTTTITPSLAAALAEAVDASAALAEAEKVLAESKLFNAATAESQSKVESGSITAAILSAQMANAEAAVRALSSGQIKARDMALGGSRTDSAYDSDTRFRAFRAPTADPPPAPSPTPKTSDLKITIDATGDELSTAIRNSLLFSQSNGSQITLQAI